MSFSAETYGTLNSKINSVATGFDHAVANADGTYTVYFVDGTSVTTDNSQLINTINYAVATTQNNSHNLNPEDYESGSISTSTGADASTSSYTRTKGYISVTSGKTLEWFKNLSAIAPNAIDIFEYDADKAFIKVTRNINYADSSGTVKSVVLGDSTKYVRIRMFNDATYDENIICLCYSDSGCTEYEKYSSGSDMRVIYEHIKNANGDTVDDIIADKISVKLKPTVLLMFDQTKIDNRLSILETNGLKGTWTIKGKWASTDIPSIKTLVTNGHDIGVYMGYNAIDDTIPLYSDTDAYANWKAYIQGSIDFLNSCGYYLPTYFGCTNHKSGLGLIQACKDLGFKYVGSVMTVVGSESVDSNTQFHSTKKNAIENVNLAPYPMPQKTVNEIKSAIDEAVEKNYIICPFTHLADGTDLVYGMTEADFTEVIEYIKSLKDAGTVDVLTVREFYNKYHQEDGTNRDYTRVMSAIINN